MSTEINCPQLVNATESLRSLANAYRDDGKYTIASALYRRAMAFLDRIHPSESRHALLGKIIEDQTSLARKMSCGRRAW